jgi:hypothetical protein
VEVGGGLDRITQPEVVLGQPGTIEEAGFEGHAAFQDPLPRFRRQQARQQALDHDPAPEAVEGDSRLVRPVAQTRLEGHAQGMG